MDQFVTQYLALALRFAAKLTGRYVEQDSPEGASALYGLFEAGRRYDATLGTPEAILYQYVRKHVYRDLEQNVKVTGSVRCKTCKGSGGREYDYELGLTSPECPSCAGTGNRNSGTPGLDHLSTADVPVEDEADGAAHRAAAILKGLDPRERDILTRRYIGGLSQVRIAADLGISRAYVGKIERAALARCQRDGEGS